MTLPIIAVNIVFSQYTNYCFIDVPVDLSTVKQGRGKGTGKVCELDWSDCSWLDDGAYSTGLWTLDKDTGLLIGS